MKSEWKDMRLDEIVKINPKIVCKGAYDLAVCNS